MFVCQIFVNGQRCDGRFFRHLFKAYGIRFVIKVSGDAGKFSIVPLLLNIGSGIGLLAIVSSLVLLFPRPRKAGVCRSGCRDPC